MTPQCFLFFHVAAIALIDCFSVTRLRVFMHLGLFPELTAMTSVTVGVNWVNLHLQYLVVGLPLHSARQNVTWIGGTRKLQLLSTQFNQKPNRALCAHFYCFPTMFHLCPLRDFRKEHTTNILKEFQVKNCKPMSNPFLKTMEQSKRFSDVIPSTLPSLSRTLIRCERRSHLSVGGAKERLLRVVNHFLARDLDLCAYPFQIQEGVP